MYFLENDGEVSALNKSFWNTFKPFISSKGNFFSDNIIIEATNDTTLTVKGSNLVSIKAKD